MIASVRRLVDWLANRWLLLWVVTYAAGFAAVYLAAVHVVPTLVALDFSDLSLPVAACAVLSVISYTARPKSH